MTKKLFFLFSIMILFTSCTKKISILNYNSVNIPLKNLQNVNITIEGSDTFKTQLQNTLPSYFNGEAILIDTKESNDILHIIENTIQTTKHFYESEDTKTVKYVSYVLDKQNNTYHPVIKERELLFFKKCLVTNYTLSASVTTRFKRDTITATISDENCRKRRYNIFNDYEFSQKDSSIFYNELVNKLALNIKSYLIPSKTIYTVEINDEIDFQMSETDEKVYENIIDMMAENIFTNNILQELQKLDAKYPYQYSINYNIGLFYEYQGENEKALIFYKNCLNIKSTKDIIKRIATVQKNIENLQKITL